MKVLSGFRFKTYGLAATLILAACILGVFNLGLLGYKFTSITLFLFIGVVYLIFHVPTLWKTIYTFLKAVGNGFVNLFKPD